MAESRATYNIQVDTRVRVQGRDDLGVGQVLRIAESGGVYQADIVFEHGEERRLETFSMNRLVAEPTLWDRLASADLDSPLDFLLAQLAHQFPLANTGGELSNARTALLPHQILLTHDLVAAARRRMLIADEVGLGKTIETGMFIRELVARKEAERILIICPAGLIKNWQEELRDAFRLEFEVLGVDFMDSSPLAWETHLRVIASVDTLKKQARKERLLSAPRWDVIVFDEAHHLSRTRYGTKINPTQNYKLADALRGHTRDLLFLSATPHQGDSFQFWSLIQLLDDNLFDSPESMLDHRGLLNRVMIRRTKREVTDAAGQPIFMRRQVTTQPFMLGVRERDFYEQLTEYLREGYGVAGLGERRTTSQQRAVGFLMMTFQKIMSSSPRAIQQSLRRRLLTVLAREQMRIESRAGARATSSDVALRLQRLQGEMRELAICILRLPVTMSQAAEADAYIAQIKQRLARRAEEEITLWALEREDEGEDVIYAESDIPDEAAKLRELLKILPDGPDRKFDTLIRGIQQLRREDPSERFVIFTQYRETLEFLQEELGKRYRPEWVCTLKGGPLDDKLAAVESFWKEGGARFLISTSAVGEGINLQICHILFNYDLPWNPMAVEQRIGRIHRYGQKDTVQVYNLVAEDTVEERIYDLLEAKLLEIARAIGRTDLVTGQVTEDFRSEILGFLGSSPNYQDLYRRALVDRDYHRTEREIAEALEKARKASEALRALAQDLDTFNLETYRALRGQFTLDDLRLFTEKAITRLGGAILPEGEFFRIETPEALVQTYPRVSKRYIDVTFDRDLAMRRRKTQLLGLGHPLTDALVDYFQSPAVRSEVAVVPDGASGALSVRCLLTADTADGHSRSEYRNFLVREDGSWAEGLPHTDIEGLRLLESDQVVPIPFTAPESLREQVKAGIAAAEAAYRAQRDDIVAVRSRIVGMTMILSSEQLHEHLSKEATESGAAKEALSIARDEGTVEAYAAAHMAGLEHGNVAVVERDFSLYAGILSEIPDGFKGMPFRVRASGKAIEFEVRVYGEDIDVWPSWTQQILFDRRKKPDLIEFRLKPRKLGNKRIQVEFYYQQHWLAQIKFEITVVKA
jgi:superfamily II DNA or RNA helicase